MSGILLKTTAFCLLSIFLSQNPLQLPEPDTKKEDKLLFEYDFEEDPQLSAFEMTDPSAWRIQEEDENKCLELYTQSKYQPRVRSPRNIAFIRGHQFGDFTLEVSLSQTGREYGHRDMCIFFGMKDPSNFYYVHLASKTDDHAHNIFLVNDEPRVKISEKTTDGIDWGEIGSWHKVKIVRKLDDGLIQVYYDDMSTPIMETHDTHFDFGYIGFGSFDDTGKIDNIKVWGSEVRKTQTGFYR